VIGLVLRTGAYNVEIRNAFYTRQAGQVSDLSRNSVLPRTSRNKKQKSGAKIGKLYFVRERFFVYKTWITRIIFWRRIVSDTLFDRGFPER